MASSVKNRKSTEQSASKRALIYLGPTISGSTLSTGAIFSGYPTGMDHLFKKIPEVRMLFVDVMEINSYKKELAVKGTEANRLYHVILTKMRGGAI